MFPIMHLNCTFLTAVRSGSLYPDFDGSYLAIELIIVTELTSKRSGYTPKNDMLTTKALACASAS